jgi:ATP-binding cassette subfamily B protein RaxB
MNALAKGIDSLKFSAFERLPMIHQTEVSECGLACLAMVSGYFGAHLDLLELRRRFPCRSRACRSLA